MTGPRPDLETALDMTGASVAQSELGLTGKGIRVGAKHVIMACWNRVTAHVVQGLPADQVHALCYARKVPLIYGRAGLNNWQAFADSKVSNVSPRAILCRASAPRSKSPI